ncbi:hypothetical protein GIB67_000482 [Kingdonia uniflora]|uniref:J domain-containing protein n=1 Tax=Kingdonia uniflora TaxID=39325 RepID=A0A7J7L0G2_9MAGN|nr:hypothetical protein GIB67_000482 [Kingdonia uniflora]
MATVSFDFFSSSVKCYPANAFQLLMENEVQGFWGMLDSHVMIPDYYKVLEVDYDATDEKIRLSYRRLALKWHPDKQKGENAVTSMFQEINEAYRVLSDPSKRLDYDLTGNYEINNYTLGEYLTRFKGMILTCNGLGMANASMWIQQPMETNECVDN